jgi:hypothetical protein
MATYGLPKGTKILAELGKIALRHGQLDNAMKMVIKDLAGVSKEEALHATAMQGSRALRERIRRLAKQRLGEGRAFVQLEALLERARGAADRRNQLLHSTWGIESSLSAEDHRVVMRDARHGFQKAPTMKELAATVEELETILDDLLTAQLGGFLADALRKKSN